MYASSVAEWHYGGARGVRRLCAMRSAGYARLRRAGGTERGRERGGAGSSGAGRAGRGGRQRSGEGRGHRAERGRRERDSIADGTALRCGRVGNRHFRESPFGLSFFVPATLLSPRCSAVPRKPMCTACVVPVKECLGWHSERSARRLPSLRV